MFRDLILVLLLSLASVPCSWSHNNKKATCPSKLENMPIAELVSRLRAEGFSSARIGKVLGTEHLDLRPLPRMLEYLRLNPPSPTQEEEIRQLATEFFGMTFWERQKAGFLLQVAPAKRLENYPQWKDGDLRFDSLRKEKSHIQGVETLFSFLGEKVFGARILAKLLHLNTTTVNHRLAKLRGGEKIALLDEERDALVHLYDIQSEKNIEALTQLQLLSNEELAIIEERWMRNDPDRYPWTHFVRSGGLGVYDCPTLRELSSALPLLLSSGISLGIREDRTMKTLDGPPWRESREPVVQRIEGQLLTRWQSLSPEQKQNIFEECSKLPQEK